MPELPDIEVFAYNLKKHYAGKKLVKLNIVNGKKLKDNPAELKKRLEGKILKDVYRSGKELRFVFSKDVLLGMHLMLTGDLIPFEGKNERRTTIIEFHFSDGKALALTDFLKNANIKLDPEDKEGVDALSTELNYQYLKEAFQRKTTIKNILLDQEIIRGIGNGYSDEILWEAGIHPFSIADAVPGDMIKILPKIIKKVLTSATKIILQNHPDLFYGEIKDYLKIHRKTESPTGKEIHVVEKSGRKTYYTDEQILYK